MSFWHAVADLSTASLVFLAIALVVAFGFEFINGFHDTANAVTTVIYTRTLRPTLAVIYSAIMNLLGVLIGGTGVAFSIVNLLPVDLLVDANSHRALVMVLSLLLAGVIWNLGTWYLGIPVSSSHTLIGCILGVGLANSIQKGNGLAGVNWAKAGEVGLALFISPIIGFVAAGGLLLVMKRLFKEPKLYIPPQGADRPPRWVRAVLICTCGGVSLAHGSNDGQKGMGLILLVLIGFLPFHYALDTNSPTQAQSVFAALPKAREALGNRALDPQVDADLKLLTGKLDGVQSFEKLPKGDRWAIRQAIFRTNQELKAANAPGDLRQVFSGAIEFVPTWVVIGVATALGIGTTIGYKRIVITVAEKIGKTHLTYAQGAAAELVAAGTIVLADFAKAPVSTTHVLSSGVAGTMAANKSGIQGATCKKILLAWVLTLPCAMVLAGALFVLGSRFVR